MIHSFNATADIEGHNGSFPSLRLICKTCGKGFYGDWEYNFTDPEAHAGCTIDGVLRVHAQIDGLLPWVDTHSAST